MKTALKTALSITTAITMLISSLFTWLVGITEQRPADTYHEVSSESFLFFDVIPRAQGLTTDGESWYYSWNFGLSKVSLDNKTVLAKNTIAIPPALIIRGYDHIGGISYYDGKIYAPIEKGPDYEQSYVAVYEANTLKFTGALFAMPVNLHVDGLPWIAVDGEKGVAYTAEWSDAKFLNVFNIDDMSFVKTVKLSQQITRIQDAEVYNGMLYVADDVHESHAIYSVDPQTGEVTHLFDRKLDPKNETEGFTVLKTADGAIFHSIDLGRLRINATLRHYAFDLE